jgi:Flp pilus assembly pilin Flp
MQWMVRFLNDESGTVVSAEIILIITIAGIGMIAGLSTYRDQAVLEMADLATSIGQLNHSYEIASFATTGVSIAGSSFVDLPDFCDDATSSTTDGNDAGTACVAIIAPSSEGAGT